jgi:hypothetical protein
MFVDVLDSVETLYLVALNPRFQSFKRDVQSCVIL